jgi:diamine N-acetyltransferase
VSRSGARSAAIHLAPVTRHNWQALAELRVAPGQERFVRSNLFSIAESRFYARARLRAIRTAAGDAVGLAFYGIEPGDRLCWLLRIMIADGHQRRGYGSAAVRLIAADVRRSYGAEALYLSVVPGNDLASALYERLGFEFTGKYKEAGWTPPQAVYRLALR